MDDAIAITLKCQAKGMLLLRIGSSALPCTLACVGGEHLLFTSLQILTPEHGPDPHKTSIEPAPAACRGADNHPLRSWNPP